MGAERWRWSTRDSSRSANRLPRKPSLPYGIARARRDYVGRLRADASYQPTWEPGEAHHEGHFGCRRPRPTAMTSRRDGNDRPRTGNPSSGFGEDLRRVLRTELLKGPCTSKEIARLFSMHHRTLSRHLAHEGVSFQQIADEIRFAIACDLLANTELALNQISVVLQFSEPSAFTRAFRHWSGQAPSAWRERHRLNRRLPEGKPE